MIRDIFISYASEDHGVAEEVRSTLESGGVGCWIAPRDVIAGASWQKAIVEAIEKCRLVVLVLSPRAVASPHVQTEIRQAFGSKGRAAGRLPIIPFRIEALKLADEFTYMLGGFQILDAIPNPTPEHFGHLLRAVKDHLAGLDKSREIAEAGEAGPLGAPRRDAGPGGPLRILVSYRRGTQPDETLTNLLDERLTALGHEVFVDRQANFSLKWGQSIEERLQSADVLIPLLSAKSSRSEMLEWEVRTAFDAAREGEKPRLMPVRVAFDGPLPPELAALLDAIPPFLWLGPRDDERLVAELAAALHGPRPIPPPRPLPVGGLPLDSESYVRRASDNIVHASIGRADSIVLVRGARQMGKTSLLARGLDRASENGARVAFSDIQRLNRADLTSPEAFYKALGAGLADDLGLDVAPVDTWNPARAANVNFETFLRLEVIEKAEKALVWGLDEVDRLFTCGFGEEVFALFRSWHNARTTKNARVWKKLTMVIGYATEAHLFITDLNQSPFNVGTTVSLEDFTPEQVADLNGRYKGPLKNDAERKAFFDLVGGHPFLVNRGLFEMAELGASLADFMVQAEHEGGLFGDHLRRMLVLLAQDPELGDVVRGLLRGTRCPTAASFYRLRAAGVISGESIGDARPRNKLYATFLKKHLS